MPKQRGTAADSFRGIRTALTARGLQETTALLTALAHEFPSVDAVYTSPAGRARHMGNAIASHFRCPLSVEPLLQEQAFGNYEGMMRVQLRSGASYKIT